MITKMSELAVICTKSKSFRQHFHSFYYIIVAGLVKSSLVLIKFYQNFLCYVSILYNFFFI